MEFLKNLYLVFRGSDYACQILSQSTLDEIHPLDSTGKPALNPALTKDQSKTQENGFCSGTFCKSIS